MSMLSEVLDGRPVADVVDEGFAFRAALRGLEYGIGQAGKKVPKGGKIVGLGAKVTGGLARTGVARRFGGSLRRSLARSIPGGFLAKAAFTAATSAPARRVAASITKKYTARKIDKGVADEITLLKKRAVSKREEDKYQSKAERLRKMERMRQRIWHKATGIFKRRPRLRPRGEKMSDEEYRKRYGRARRSGY